MDTLYRQWLILRMIPRRGKIATTEILSRLKSQHSVETTLRTVQRDLSNHLSGIFELECDEYRPAGWKWKEEAPLLEMANMDPVTALTFKLAETYLARMVPRGVASALQPYAKSAERILKTADLPLSRWPDKVRIMSRNLTTIPPEVPPEISDTVFAAVLEEKRFKASYRTIGNRVKNYEVNPFCLAFVDGLTYLVASLNEHVDPVLLLLHRFQAAALLDKPVTTPEDFCLDDWVTELLTFAVGDTIRLKLRFTSRADVQRLQESPLSADQKIRELPDGSHELTARVEDTLQLRWWLQGYGARVEVLAPKGLRQEFVELAKNYSEIYRGSSPKTIEAGSAVPGLA